MATAAVMMRGSATARRNGSLQSRRNKADAGIWRTRAMVTAARDRLAKTLRGDAETAARAR